MPPNAGWTSASPASTGAGVWPLYAKVRQIVLAVSKVPGMGDAAAGAMDEALG